MSEVRARLNGEAHYAIVCTDCCVDCVIPFDLCQELGYDECDVIPINGRIRSSAKVYTMGRTKDP